MYTNNYHGLDKRSSGLDSRLMNIKNSKFGIGRVRAIGKKCDFRQTMYAVKWENLYIDK